MISFLTCALLVWTVDPNIAWLTQPREGRGPRVAPGAAQDRALLGSWELHFPSGQRHEAGYVQIPIDGDRLAAHGLQAIEVEGTAKTAAMRIDVVLVCADEAYRTPLTLDRRRKTVNLPIAEFRGDRGGRAEPSNRIRFLRFESPKVGMPREASFEIHALRFHLEEDAPSRIKAEELQTAALPRDRSALYPFGAYIMGGNRSLLEDFALAGANTTVEYGPRSWAASVVEDHLDFAKGMGVWNVPVLSRERDGVLIDSIDRLAPLLAHPALLAVATTDEPDAGKQRGLREEYTSPKAVEHLRGRVRQRAAAPVLLTCMDSFSLSRYEAGGDVLSIDLYLPAFAPERSFADIHSAAASVVEIAARSQKTPSFVLQLVDPQWPAPEQQPTPASMRAQSLAVLATGVRGIFFFQAVSAIRQAHAGTDSLGLWKGFLDLAGEFAAIAPVVSDWRAIPGEPALDPPLGEVRAAAFRGEAETWIVLVNLGRAPSAVTLSGSVLQGVTSLVDVRDGWRAKVSGGEWRGTLAPLEAHVLRAEQEPLPARSSRLLETSPTGTLHFNRAVVGATIHPAPSQPPRLSLDGRDRTSEATVHQGASTVLRLAARDLPPGAHRVQITWTDGKAARESTWTFQVNGVALPIRERFSSPRLDATQWTPIDDVLWGVFDPAERPARGTAVLENGRLHVRSTGGSFGVIWRRVEAPLSFDMTWTVELPRAGKIAVQRNEQLRKIDLPQGRSRVTLRERLGAQVFLVENREVARFTPPIDHQGGVIGIGVSAGGEAYFDDIFLEPKSSR